MVLEEMLINLDKKINAIEEKDEDFRNNTKWKDLRKQQDELYLALAERRKFECLNYYNASGRETDLQRAEFYDDYIKKNKKTE